MKLIPRFAVVAVLSIGLASCASTGGGGPPGGVDLDRACSVADQSLRSAKSIQMIFEADPETAHEAAVVAEAIETFAPIKALICEMAGADDPENVADQITLALDTARAIVAALPDQKHRTTALAMIEAARIALAATGVLNPPPPPPTPSPPEPGPPA